MNVYRSFLRISFAAIIICWGCMRTDAVHDKDARQPAPPGRADSLPDRSEAAHGESSQILLVRNREPNPADLTAVQVVALDKRDGRWRNAFPPMDGVIGRNGFAPPGEKREGDGRTPSGIFPLGTVFGYEASASTRMPYRRAGDDDLWIDDVNADDYNRWVTRGTTKAASFEKMKREDDLYRLGIVIEYNTSPVVRGLGSAIFFHLWSGKGRPTAGCVGLSEGDLVRIVQWLDPAARPVVVMGTDATVGGYE